MTCPFIRYCSTAAIQGKSGKTKILFLPGAFDLGLTYNVNLETLENILNKT